MTVAELAYDAEIDLDYYKRHAAFIARLMFWLRFVALLGGSGALLALLAPSGPASAEPNPAGLWAAFIGTLASLLDVSLNLADLHARTFALAERWVELHVDLTLLAPDSAVPGAMLARWAAIQKAEPAQRTNLKRICYNAHVARTFGAAARPEAYFRLSCWQRLVAHVMDWDVDGVAMPIKVVDQAPTE